MIASLPMYWRAENAAQWTAFWSLVQKSCAVDLPDLTPPEDIPDPWTQHWLRPDLALSMTCGLPFRTTLRDRVAYVGTLGFGTQTHKGHYYSCRIVRPETMAGVWLSDKAADLRLAYNAADSQSGWATAAAAAADQGYADYIETGSHAASLQAVANGQADIAYLDAVTWILLQHYDPAARNVVVWGTTPPTPALPLITALGQDVGALQSAVRIACDMVSPEIAEAIGGTPSMHILTPQMYYDIAIPQAPAKMTPRHLHYLKIGNCITDGKSVLMNRNQILT